MVKVPRKASQRKKGLTKVQKAQVKALVVAPSEGKYVADTAVTFNGFTPIMGTGVATNIVSGGAAITAWTMIPVLTVGAGSQQRLGNKVTDVTIRNDFQFWLNPAVTNNPTADYTVKVYILKPKPIKSNGNAQNLPINNFYDSGQGTRLDYTPAGGATDKAIQMLPVNKEQFTVVKIVTFRLAKNQDAQTNGTGAACAPNLAMAQTKNFSHTYKHQGALIYPAPATGLSQIPENLALMAFACVWDSNGAGIPATSPTPAVLANQRTHMYFKDV